MLRVLIISLAALWVVATVGRFARRIGRGPLIPVRGAGPAPDPEPRDDRLIGVLRLALGAALVIALFFVATALTDLPELPMLLGSALAAGVLSSFITERFVADDEDES